MCFGEVQNEEAYLDQVDRPLTLAELRFTEFMMRNVPGFLRRFDPELSEEDCCRQQIERAATVRCERLARFVAPTWPRLIIATPIVGFSRALLWCAERCVRFPLFGLSLVRFSDRVSRFADRVLTRRPS